MRGGLKSSGYNGESAVCDMYVPAPEVVKRRASKAEANADFAASYESKSKHACFLLTRIHLCESDI